VLVVGAGPTGLLSANLLGTYGVETLLVERNATTSDLPKAILLDDEGLRALQSVGLVEKIIARVISGYGARYYAVDGSCFAEVSSPITCHGYPRRNAFLQPDLEKIMGVGLERFSHVHAQFETQLISVESADDGCIALVQLADGSRKNVRCDFVLACDGARSTVRELLGIAMPGMTDARDWVVIDTINDPDQDRFSKFFCDPARPMVSIPAPGNGRRYEYMVLPGEDSAEMSTRETIRSILSQFRHVPDADILRAVVYTFHARVAERLTAGRIMLLGDAAHLTPPFAGQGMNAGLRDAFNVAWKLKLALEGQATPDIVETYQTERLGPIVEMVEYAVALGEIVMPVGGLDDAAKNEIRANLMGEDAASGDVVVMRPKPLAVYERGWRLTAKKAGGGGLTGQACPQIKVATPAGEIMFLDDILGSGFALVALGDEAIEALNALVPLKGSGLLPKTVSICLEESTKKAGSLYLTGDDFGLKAHADTLILVRPDRYIAAHWNVESAAKIPGDISRLCR
jgi:3-(3-hydroxy-phenyl)propionate hydroxylase